MSEFDRNYCSLHPNVTMGTLAPETLLARLPVSVEETIYVSSNISHEPYAQSSPMVVKRGYVVKITPVGIHLLDHNYNRHQNKGLGSPLRKNISTSEVVLFHQQDCIKHSGDPGSIPGTNSHDRTNQRQVSATAHGQSCGRIIHPAPGRNPQSDLFASPTNTKLSRFILRLPHPQAKAVDVLLSPWRCTLAYAFPPHLLISKFITRLLTEPILVNAVLPYWPRCPWFPLAMHLSTQQPVKIPIMPHLLFQGNLSHPNHLQVWILKVKITSET